MVYYSENQQLITEVVGYVKSGDGIGWLSTKKMRRVVAYEGLRQYLINQIDLEQKSNMNTLNDVVSLKLLTIAMLFLFVQADSPCFYCANFVRFITLASKKMSL